MSPNERKSHLLRADLHTHNRFSPDSIAEPVYIVERCKSVGIDCLAVTNHNTIKGVEETRQAAVELYPELIVITGEEITTSETNGSGKRIELLAYFIQETIPEGLPIEQTLKMIQNQGALVSIPHPTEEWRHGLGLESAPIVIRLAKEMGLPVLWENHNSRSSRGNNEKSQDFAKTQNNLFQAGLLTSAGSDAHHPREIGRAKLWLPTRYTNETKEGFLRNLQIANSWVTRYQGDDRWKTTLVARILTRFGMTFQKKR